jgi:hypothetical protein
VKVLQKWICSGLIVLYVADLNLNSGGLVNSSRYKTVEMNVGPNTKLIEQECQTQKCSFRAITHIS